jgi:ABC-type Fe3+ transport system substrate-binding protein
MRKSCAERRRAGVIRGAATAMSVGLAVTLLAACGSGGGGTPASESGVDWNSLTVEQLYEGAKKEGKFVLYSGQSRDDLNVLAARFHEQYPGIEIESFEQQGEDSASKLTSEANAGVHTTDIIDTEQNTIYQLAQLNLLATYTPPAASSFDSRLKKPWFTGHRVQIKPITYNTQQVPKAQAPQNYDALLEQRWNGKLCAEASEVSVFADMLQQMGRDQGIAYWKQLTANGLRFVNGQTNLVESVIAGDCTIAVAANVHNVANAMDKGAPVAWVKTDPLYANYGALGVLDRAPHPYAARLWTNYVLSDAGQQSVADNYRIPVNPNVQPREPELKQGTFNMVLAGDEVMNNFAEYNKLFYETTGRPVVG